MVQIRFMRKPAQLDAVSTFITCESNMQWLKQQNDLLVVALGGSCLRRRKET